MFFVVRAALTALSPTEPASPPASEASRPDALTVELQRAANQEAFETL